MTLPNGTEEPRPIPRFLTEFTPTMYTKRLRPLSRKPAVAKLGDVWHVCAQRNPGQLLIVDRAPDIDPDGATTRTFVQWAELVDQAAAWLYAAGVRGWDRVAVMKTNHFDICVLGSAIARLGAIPCMLSGTYDAETVQILLTRLEKPFLLTDRAHIDKCGITKEVVEGLTVKTISVDGVDGIEDRPDIEALASFRGAPPAPVRMREMHEPQIITHTSGTTGYPKLVMHSPESVYSMGVVESDRWPFWLKAKDTMVFCDPFTHERLTTMMLAIATITPRMVMLSDPFSPRVRELIVEHKPTVVEALPNIFLAWEPLARDPARIFRQVRIFLNSFDAIHTRTIRIFMSATEVRLPLWIQSWSQSENGVLVMRPYIRAMVRKRGVLPPPTQLLGWPLFPHARLRAVDPATGEKVKHGAVGLIEISQPGRCLAYVQEQDRHDLKVVGKWWNTGDLGIINRLGAVRLVDREVDRIDNGDAVSGIAIEDVLLDRLPQTTEVVVLPQADGLPVPVVSTQDNVPLDPGEWADATADLPKLAPLVQIAWEEFPRTGTWKIRRLLLRENLLGAKGIGIGRWT
ncbi:AMP-binding protein [Yinghuangia seranimata]|uniref:AMP-binding protein n=1 Tax=Yinghuangia seranimata TaxID=408067 RepID=UPI00248BD4B4|nr:class I adenylate-forming enzyme family protein [Yinghuangia seranimata]MDI2130932.1 class I adenylate-forming enzyme family protein [Yinghuangia seranimata]